MEKLKVSSDLELLHTDKQLFKEKRHTNGFVVTMIRFLKIREMKMTIIGKK